MKLGGMYSTGFGLGALRSATQAAERSMERLATGKQINRASDNASGMVAVEAFKAELASLNKGVQADERMILTLGAKEGGLSVVQDLILELEGLVVTAAGSGTRSPEELEALQLEANSIIEAIDTLAYSTTYNGQSILDGYSSTSLGKGSLTVQTESADPEANGTDEAQYQTLATSLASIRGGGLLNLVDGDLEAAQKAVQGARESITSTRAAIGNQQRSLETDIATSRAQIEAITGAVSDIEDTDYAKEVSELVRAQILEQASLQTILIGRQSAEGVLALLSSAALAG